MSYISSCDADSISGSSNNYSPTAPVPEVGIEVPCYRIGGESAEISKWGGPRANSGGARPGSGRPRKVSPVEPAPCAVESPRWYCVRTEYGAEITADMTIRKDGFETFFPMEWVPPVAARRTADGRAIPARSERLVPLLPRYLFVKFDRSKVEWRRITTMRGVERIFSVHPDRPTPLAERDIAELRSTLAPNGVKYPDVAPAKGASVKKRWISMLDGLAGILRPETA